MKTYTERKENAREEAIDWQTEASEGNMSYAQLLEAGDHFYKLGKRYGLLREFRENGIPC